MEDRDVILASVAQCIEQLRQKSFSAQEKEYALKNLLEFIETRENALSDVGSHSQAAAKTVYAVSQGNDRDHVGSKIFSTEGVVPVLWEQLGRVHKGGNLVNELMTGALKNLSTNTEGFWPATMRAGGMDILVKLLASGESGTQANVCFLIACVMMDDASVCPTILEGGAIKLLLKLLVPGNEASVRVGAVGALKSLSAQCKEARKEIANANGIPSLINATIAPSKEFMQGEFAQDLQENAMCALANISGGLSSVIFSLGKSCNTPNSENSGSYWLGPHNGSRP